MGHLPTEQRCESKKVRIRRRPVAVAPASRDRRMGPKQAGTLWQRRMHTLAIRRTKRGVRRDSAGRPMKRG